MKSFAAFAIFSAATAAQDVLSFETSRSCEAPEATHEFTRNEAAVSVTTSFEVAHTESLTGSGEVGKELIASDTVVNYSHKTTISVEFDAFQEDTRWGGTLCSLNADTTGLDCQTVYVFDNNDTLEYDWYTYTLAETYFTYGDETPIDDGSDLIQVAINGATLAGINIVQDGNFSTDTWVDISAFADFEFVFTHERTLGDSQGNDYTYADIGSTVSSPCELLLAGEAPESNFFSVVQSDLADTNGGYSVHTRVTTDITTEVFEEYHEVCSGATYLAASAATALAFAVLAM